MDEIKNAKLRKRKVRKRKPPTPKQSNTVAALLEMRRDNMGYDSDSGESSNESSSDWDDDE